MRLSRQFQTSLFKNFTSTRSTKRLQRTKTKNALKKHLRGKKSLICLFAFCAFAWVSLCLLVLLVLLVRAKYFCKKKNKRFKTVLIILFILLLNLSNYKHKFFNHNLFQLLQSFPIIVMFFIRIHFLSQSFLISL